MPVKALRILGIDPGTIRTGWGVVERQGNRLAGVSAGVLRLGAQASLSERLLRLDDGLLEIFDKEQPDVVAIEEIFFAKHPNAALKLGHARGVAMLAAARRCVPVHAYTPAVVKQTVAGRGGADKVQVACLLRALLSWPSLEAGDASDALAIAVTHAQASLSPRGQLGALRKSS